MVRDIMLNTLKVKLKFEAKSLWVGIGCHGSGWRCLAIGCAVKFVLYNWQEKPISSPHIIDLISTVSNYSFGTSFHPKHPLENGHWPLQLTNWRGQCLSVWLLAYVTCGIISIRFYSSCTCHHHQRIIKKIKCLASCASFSQSNNFCHIDRYRHAQFL